MEVAPAAEKFGLYSMGYRIWRRHNLDGTPSLSPMFYPKEQVEHEKRENETEQVSEEKRKSFLLDDATAAVRWPIFTWEKIDL